MTLEISKYSDGTFTTEYLQVEKMTNLLEPNSLLLVKEYEVDEEGQSIRNIAVKKIQFIANCKTKIDQELLVAFYIHDEGYLYHHILTELDGNYYCEPGILVDYKSYAEICELTGETKLSFEEYYEQLKNGYIGVNSIAYLNDKAYNFTEQQEMWKVIKK